MSDVPVAHGQILSLDYLLADVVPTPGEMENDRNRSQVGQVSCMRLETLPEFMWPTR